MSHANPTRAAVWTVVVLITVVFGVRQLGADRTQPTHIELAAPGVSGAEQDGSVIDDASRLTVHVVGEVRRPGVITVPLDARVGDAVARAGGLTHQASPTAVNLAARLQDGQQVVVATRPPAIAAGAIGSPSIPGGQSGATTAGGTATAVGQAGPISLSTATVEQLETIDGIGPTLGARIVEYREANGFGSVDELAEVEGIGESRLAGLKAALTP